MARLNRTGLNQTSCDSIRQDKRVLPHKGIIRLPCVTITARYDRRNKAVLHKAASTVVVPYEDE